MGCRQVVPQQAAFVLRQDFEDVRQVGRVQPAQFPLELRKVLPLLHNLEQIPSVNRSALLTASHGAQHPMALEQLLHLGEHLVKMFRMLRKHARMIAEGCVVSGTGGVGRAPSACQRRVISRRRRRRHHHTSHEQSARHDLLSVTRDHRSSGRSRRRSAGGPSRCAR